VGLLKQNKLYRMRYG